jgi:hypothetical protein
MLVCHRFHMIISLLRCILSSPTLWRGEYLPLLVTLQPVSSKYVGWSPIDASKSPAGAISCYIYIIVQYCQYITHIISQRCRNPWSSQFSDPSGAVHPAEATLVGLGTARAVEGQECGKDLRNLWKSQVKGRLMDDFMRFSCNFSDIFWRCSLIFILFLTRPRTWRRNMLKWGDKPTRSNKLQSVVYELRHEMARKRNLQLSWSWKFLNWNLRIL